MGKKSWFSCLGMTALFAVFIQGCSAIPFGHSLIDTKRPAKTEEPVTFSYFIADPGYVPERSTVGDMIQKKTGVTVKYERLVGELQAKLGVMIASHDYPDFIYGQNQMGSLVEAKALIPLEGLIEAYAPNIKRLYSGIWNRLKDPKDGHIYVLPFGVPQGQNIQEPTYSPAFWIQKQVLKELGYPKIRTLDEYFAAIETYKKLHPVTENNEPTIGYEILTADWRNFTLTTPPQFLAGYPNDSRALVDPQDGFKLTYFATDDISKRWFKKLNEEYVKGIVDPEAFVMSYEQYLAKLTGGRVLGMFDHGWQFLDAQSSLKRQGKFMQMYVPLPVLFDAGMTDDYIGPPTVNYGQGFGMTIKCKDPVRAMKYLDFMAGTETQMLINWGIQGTDYNVVNGRFVRNAEQRERFNDKKYIMDFNGGNLFYFYPNASGTMPDGNAYDPSQQPEEIEAAMDDTDKELLKAYGVRTYGQLFSKEKQNRGGYYPLWTVGLSEKGKKFEQQLGKLQIQILPKLVLAKNAEEFDSLWDTYRKSVDNIGTDEYLQELREGIEWRQHNW